MRVVFVNLHSDWMLLRVAMVYVFKYSAAIKHGYLLKYLLEHPKEYEVCNYINDRGFSLFTNGNGIFMKFLNKLSGIENRITLKKNGIKPKHITILKHPEEIRKDDIVILYNVCHEGLRGMNQVNAFKALSMLHFHGRKEENADIRCANISCYFNEVDLSATSEIFRKYYSVKCPWVIHPFVFAERFRNMKPFKERKNKCFSTGTITYKKHDEFLSVYGDPCDQPARKFVKDNPEYFKDTVDCYSSDYLEDNSGKPVNAGDNTLLKLYKKIYNRTHVGKQKKYFSFDMLEKFNEYKMCLIGEEILGVPGIGYVEGMACGCAYIGIDSSMYRDLGLIPGTHYIVYDGTKEGLRKVVKYYQKEEHQEELEQIAKAGCEFVRTHFNGQTTAETLMSKLKEEQQKWLRK